MGSLGMIALWLWMARTNGQGRNWGRILSTVLSGLATLQLISVLQQPVSHAGFDVTVLGLLGTVLTLSRSEIGSAWLPAVLPGIRRRAHIR